MRVAIYSTNAQEHPLTKAGSNWLGRCAFSGEQLERPQLAQITESQLHEFTAFSARYGWHGTMKAPFHLADSQSLDKLQTALKAFCAQAAPFIIPSMNVVLRGDFIALSPSESCSNLSGLEEQIVRRFEPFRRPWREEELTAKKQANSKQQQYLEQFGYPNVFDLFTYHRTIAGPLPQKFHELALSAAKDHFKHFKGRPLTFDHLGLYIEPNVPGPFVVHDLFPLTGETLFKPSYELPAPLPPPLPPPLRDAR